MRDLDKRLQAGRSNHRCLAMHMGELECSRPCENSKHVSIASTNDWILNLHIFAT